MNQSAFSCACVLKTIYQKTSHMYMDFLYRYPYIWTKFPLNNKFCEIAHFSYSFIVHKVQFFIFYF